MLCPHQTAAYEFLKHLGLPDSYFNDGYDRCYCDRCYSSTWPDTHTDRNENGTMYVVPRGWVGFGLEVPRRALDPAIDMFHNWSVSFHGTKAPVVKTILQNGSFAVPGDKL